MNHLQSNLSNKSIACAIIDYLVSNGSDTFFGIPGGPVCPIFEAIRLNPKARLIESRHESHAGFAASTFYKASKKIPVVVITAGPGITNAVNGIASAYLENTPMLVIAGDVAWNVHGGKLAQDSGPEGLNVESIYKSLTKKIVRVNSNKAVLGQIQNLLDVSKDGPTMLVVPINKAMEEYKSDITITSDCNMDRYKDILSVIENSERPLLIIGAGCRKVSSEALLAFVNNLKIPFVTTPRAKGFVDETHPLSLKTCGMGASMWAKKYTNDKPIDACLVIGTDLDDTSLGSTPPIGPNGKLIHIDLDASNFNRNYNTHLGIICDVESFIGIFNLFIKSKIDENDYLCALSINHKFENLLDDVKTISPFDISSPELDDSLPIKPHRVLKDLENVSNQINGRFITDIGEHMIFCLHYLTSKPNNFNIELNLGSMGSGIAGAIGLGIADKNRPIICVVGDGCMQMSGMEILVAQKEKLPIVFVVFNDGRYNMVHHGMKQIFGAAEQYKMTTVNFAYWAASFGIPSFEVTRPDEITKDAIETLLSYGGPAVIDVRIDSSVRIRGTGRIEALQKMSMSELNK